MANSYQRSLILLLGSLVVSILWACSGGGSNTRSTNTDNKDQDNSDKAGNAEIVNAVDLCNSYLADKSGAQRRYKGKTIECRGEVHTAEWPVDKDEGLFVILETGTKGFIVTAWFDKAHEKEVLALNKGQTIRVRGRVGDVGVDEKHREVFVSLDQCVIVEPR